VEKKIDEEILSAEKKREEWRKIGFKGDSSLLNEEKEGVEEVEEEVVYKPKPVEGMPYKPKEILYYDEDEEY